MSVVSQESYEGASNMLLTEPISPNSSVTTSSSPVYSVYPLEEHTERVHKESILDSQVFTPTSVDYHNDTMVSTQV